MSMQGIIILFPSAGSPPQDLDAKARELIRCFERTGLLAEGTSAICEAPEHPWMGRFAELRNQGEIQPEDYALFIVKAERILPAMADLVKLFTPEEFGCEGEESFPGTYGLPDIEISVIRQARPIVRGADGEEIANTWATIEFSYGAFHFHPELHQILDDQHPLFAELAKALGSPVAWDVDIG